jgi:hypothetical protein
VPASQPSNVCGRFTQNGCYTTYRKFTAPSGQPELRCVETCDQQ